MGIGNSIKIQFELTALGGDCTGTCLFRNKLCTEISISRDIRFLLLQHSHENADPIRINLDLITEIRHLTKDHSSPVVIKSKHTTYILDNSKYPPYSSQLFDYLSQFYLPSTNSRKTNILNPKKSIRSSFLLSAKSSNKANKSYLFRDKNCLGIELSSNSKFILVHHSLDNANPTKINLDRVSEISKTEDPPPHNNQKQCYHLFSRNQGIFTIN